MVVTSPPKLAAPVTATLVAPTAPVMVKLVEFKAPKPVDAPMVCTPVPVKLRSKPAPVTAPVLLAPVPVAMVEAAASVVLFKLTAPLALLVSRPPPNVATPLVVTLVATTSPVVVKLVEAKAPKPEEAAMV